MKVTLRFIRIHPKLIQMDLASGFITFVRWTMLGSVAVLALMVLTSLVIPPRSTVAPRQPSDKR